MATPVETVGASERMDGLFQVGPDQPDLHPCLLVSEHIGKRQKNRRARCAVVRSDKSRFKESVIVSSENKNILVRIGADVELADDVAHRNRATGRGSDEVVGFDLRSVPLQSLMDQVLCLLMTGRSGPAFSEPGNFSSVGVGLSRIECVVQGARRGGRNRRYHQGSNHAELKEHTNILRPMLDSRTVASNGGRSATAEALVNRMKLKK